MYKRKIPKQQTAAAQVRTQPSASCTLVGPVRACRPPPCARCVLPMPATARPLRACSHGCTPRPLCLTPPSPPRLLGPCHTMQVAIANQAATLAAYEAPDSFVRPGYQAADQVTGRLHWPVSCNRYPMQRSGPARPSCWPPAPHPSTLPPPAVGRLATSNPYLTPLTPQPTCSLPRPHPWPAAAAHGPPADRGRRDPGAAGAAGGAVLARRRQVVPHPVHVHPPGLAQGRVSWDRNLSVTCGIYLSATARQGRVSAAGRLGVAVRK